MASWLQYNSDAGVTPKKAATVILFDQETNATLLVQRNKSLVFMGGHHAFPGGSVSQQDTGRCVRGTSDTDLAVSISTAVREVFEETGILLVDGDIPGLGHIERMRLEILQSPDKFEDFLEQYNLLIQSEKFIPAGRWITPTFVPMRFDTQYFLYCCKGGIPASPIGQEGEITATTWLNVDKALDLRAKGRIQMSTPVVFVLRRLAVLSLDKVVKRLQHTPGFSEIIHDYIEPAHGIHIVPVSSQTLPPASHTNCVLIGEKELALIDPGINDLKDRERFEAHLDEVLTMSNGILHAILLTHDHPDHSASVHRLAKRYNVPVYAHESYCKRDIAIEEGFCIELVGAPPWRIRCLYTPGHHPGHFAFYEETTDTLISGDMVSNPGTIIIDPESGGDMGAYLNSLDRLSTLVPKMTIPGHGVPLMADSGTELFRKTIVHRRMREARIREAITSGANTVETILLAAYDDTPEALYPLARRQLKAHLIDMNIVI